MKKFKHKHLLGIEPLSKEDITQILDTAKIFKGICKGTNKKFPALKGKLILNLFMENSTRTRSSFEIAEKRLGADTLNFSASASSLSKGESFYDTIKTLESMEPHIVVIRHSSPGSSRFLADNIDASVVNAGDGAHEHPTQALLDAYTIREALGTLEGLNIVIAGDIKHSRVVRSNIWLLKKMGNNVTLSGPPTLIPVDVDKLGVNVDYNFDNAIKDADAVMMLRIQRERMVESFFPSLQEFNMLYGLTRKRMKSLKEGAIVMHPGPINRGVEINSEVADSKRSVILEQVSNGIYVRMAVLFLLAGGQINEISN